MVVRWIEAVSKPMESRECVSHHLLAIGEGQLLFHAVIGHVLPPCGDVPCAVDEFFAGLVSGEKLPVEVGHDDADEVEVVHAQLVDVVHVTPHARARVELHCPFQLVLLADLFKPGDGVAEHQRECAPLILTALHHRDGYRILEVVKVAIELARYVGELHLGPPAALRQKEGPHLPVKAGVGSNQEGAAGEDVLPHSSRRLQEQLQRPLLRLAVGVAVRTALVFTRGDFTGSWRCDVAEEAARDHG
mmetsp:Transcript_10407/g.25170  ORF Transcript_10407/g.25170 Transcript_10407/m.25170 type:complete len:246 (-) Transcript_10407:182-919(-)